MGGVTLKELKEHTQALGGHWGADSWATLVRENAEEMDTLEVESDESSGRHQSKKGDPDSHKHLLLSHHHGSGRQP